MEAIAEGSADTKLSETTTITNWRHQEVELRKRGRPGLRVEVSSGVVRLAEPASKLSPPPVDVRGLVLFVYGNVDGE